MPILTSPRFISDETGCRSLFPNGEAMYFPALYLWKITETADELLEMLPPETGYEEEIRKFRADTRKREWLATRALLHKALGSRARLDYRETGKPYLKDGKLDVSISHTKGYAAIALHTAPVGIDIEQHSPRALALAGRFLQEPETGLLQSGGLPEDRATSLWSAKEAVYKLFGMDAPELRESICLSERPEGLQATLSEGIGRATIRIAIHKDFILTLALRA